MKKILLLILILIIALNVFAIGKPPEDIHCGTDKMRCESYEKCISDEDEYGCCPINSCQEKSCQDYGGYSCETGEQCFGYVPFRLQNCCVGTCYTPDPTNQLCSDLEGVLTCEENQYCEKGTQASDGFCCLECKNFEEPIPENCAEIGWNALCLSPSICDTRLARLPNGTYCCPGECISPDELPKPINFPVCDEAILFNEIDGKIILLGKTWESAIENIKEECDDFSCLWKYNSFICINKTGFMSKGDKSLETLLEGQGSLHPIPSTGNIATLILGLKELNSRYNLMHFYLGINPQNEKLTIDDSGSALTIFGPKEAGSEIKKVNDGILPEFNVSIFSNQQQITNSTSAFAVANINNFNVYNSKIEPKFPTVSFRNTKNILVGNKGNINNFFSNDSITKLKINLEGWINFNGKQELKELNLVNGGIALASNELNIKAETIKSNQNSAFYSEKKINLEATEKLEIENSYIWNKEGIESIFLNSINHMSLINSIILSQKGNVVINAGKEKLINLDNTKIAAGYGDDPRFWDVQPTKIYNNEINIGQTRCSLLLGNAEKQTTLFGAKGGKITILNNAPVPEFINFNPNSDYEWKFNCGGLIPINACRNAGGECTTGFCQEHLSDYDTACETEEKCCKNEGTEPEYTCVRDYGGNCLVLLNCPRGWTQETQGTCEDEDEICCVEDETPPPQDCEDLGGTCVDIIELCNDEETNGLCDSDQKCCYTCTNNIQQICQIAPCQTNHVGEGTCHQGNCCKNPCPYSCILDCETQGGTIHNNFFCQIGDCCQLSPEPPPTSSEETIYIDLFLNKRFIESGEDFDGILRVYNQTNNTINFENLTFEKPIITHLESGTPLELYDLSFEPQNIPKNQSRDFDFEIYGPGLKQFFGVYDIPISGNFTIEMTINYNKDGLSITKSARDYFTLYEEMEDIVVPEIDFVLVLVIVLSVLGLIGYQNKK